MSSFKQCLFQTSTESGTATKSAISDHRWCKLASSLGSQIRTTKSFVSSDILAEVEKKLCCLHSFCYFLRLIREKSKIKNDPTLIYDTYFFHTVRKKDSPEKNSRSKVSPRTPICHRLAQSNVCPFHKPGHPLNKGNGFKSKSIEEQRSFLIERSTCLKCSHTIKHHKNMYKTVIMCDDCGSSFHALAMHVDGSAEGKNSSIPSPSQAHGGE